MNRFSGRLLAPIFVVLSAFAVAAQDLPDDAPILISVAGSTRILANDPDRKGETVNNVRADERERLTIYVTNLDLLADEGVNALRLDAQDSRGVRFPIVPEKLEPLADRPWVYALTIRLSREMKNVGDVLVRLNWRGVASNRVRMAIGFESKLPSDDAGAKPTPMPDKPPTRLRSQNLASLPWQPDRVRFMQQSTFGSNPTIESRIRRIGYSTWLNEQMEEKRDAEGAVRYSTYPYPSLDLQATNIPTSCTGNCVRDNYSMYPLQKWFFREVMYGEDQQLRRRVSWALSQIWVVSGRETIQPSRMMPYVQTLDRHAFGNYRDLMREMTLNPAMGNYLDMAISTKQNPNENYAREILQLFTIGLYMLNQDGTPKLDSNGEPVPSYTQNEVNGFTKVFTGWTFCGQGCPNSRPGIVNFRDPLVLNEANHDTTDKQILDYPGSVPLIPAGMSAQQDFETALDNIFFHPNVGPFVGKLLIQQLVTSNPTPAYVSRVAAKFNDNGSGIRGDMKAVIRAILTDPEARGNFKTDPDYGHLREPIQFLSNVLRPANVGANTGAPASCNAQSDGAINLMTLALDQDAFNPPSVFNYYPFTYTLQNTTLGAPEFGIFSTGTALKRANAMNQLIFGGGIATGGNSPCGTRIDISRWQQLAADDASNNALVDALNAELLSGTMSPQVRNHIMTALATVTDVTKRTRTALYLVATSPQYQVQR